MLPAQTFLMGACALALLIGCSGGDDRSANTQNSNLTPTDSSAQTTERSSEAQSETTQAKQTPAPQPTNTRARETVWDRAEPLDSDVLFLIYLEQNPELFEKREIIEYFACADPKINYDSIAQNEFSFEDELKTAAQKRLDAIESLKTRTGLGSGEQIFIKGEINGELGEYDFDNQAFAFDPFNFDYLEQSNGSRAICGYRKPYEIHQPEQWPDQFRFTITNGDALETLPMPVDEAKALIESFGYANPGRSVGISFVMSIPDRGMTYMADPNPRRVGWVETDARIVTAEITSALNGSEKYMTLSESFFE